ncbi:MAG: homoserine kinase [Actinobacteria bacterium]|nr:homoserine kinase [Actinomycetota bacterium]
MRLSVRSPATVANLGPGFDALGLALDLANEVELDTDGEGVRVEGEGAGEVPTDDSNLVHRALVALSTHAGRPLPPFGLRCRNRIPLERGLGSSASAVAAGLALAAALLEMEVPVGVLLGLAEDLEGHVDNAAACLLGGLTIAHREPEGWRAARLVPHPDLRPVVLVPGGRLTTARARRALPETVPFGDAAFTAGRAALLVHALTEDPALLPAAMQDRLHEPTRLELSPETAEAARALRARGVAVCVAGSGPSLVAFEQRPGAVPTVVPGFEVLGVTVAPSGALGAVAAG